MSRIWITTYAAVLVVLGLASPSLAICACADESDCSAYANSSDVFVAHVTDVVANGQGSMARLVVTRVLRGAAGSYVEFPVGGECELKLQPGDDYLVYAQRNQGKLVSSGCSHTRAVSNTDADMKFIESLATPPLTARVFGYINTVPQGDPDLPLRVTLDGGGRHYEIAATENGGTFEVDDVIPGTYRLRIMKQKAVLYQVRRAITLRAGACEYAGLFEIPIP